MDQGQFAVGVDGGASTLRFAIQTPDGAVFHSEARGGNPNLIGMENYFTRLFEGVTDALKSLDATPDQVGAAGFGLSGVDRPDDVNYLRRHLRRAMLNCTRLWVGNDALPALRQGAGSLRGIVLIAGTGSICFGVTTDGQSVRVGGWGGEIGDEGSGFWIGLRGVQAACRMADGRLEETKLLARVLRKLSLEKPVDLIPWSSNCTRWEFKQQVAAVFPIVAQMAVKGDHTSKQTILMALGHLVQHVLAAEGKLRETERASLLGRDTITPDQPTEPAPARTKLVCHGGLFAENKDFFDAFVAQLQHKKDAFDPVRLTEPASLGALALGFEAKPVQSGEATGSGTH